MKRILFLLLAMCLIVPMASAFNYTVGSTGYDFGQQFTTTANAGTGTLSGYQIMLNVSNSTGVSTSTILYTNGSTQVDWDDVVFTDGSNNQLPFWIENNTYTATGASVWVKVPSITTAGSSVRVYYGNVSKASSEMNGYNTFDLFDDFIGSSLNASQWSSTGGSTVSGGILSIYIPGAGTYQTVSKTRFGVNYTVISRIRPSHYSTSSYVEAFKPSYYDDNNQIGAFYSHSTATIGNKYYTFISGSGSGVAISGIFAATYSVQQVRKSPWSINWSVDKSNYVTQWPYYTGVGNITFTVANADSGIASDWVAVTKYNYPEPTFSSFTGIPSSAIAPTASFTKDISSGELPLTVTFTDTSTQSPTSFNWTFKDTAGNNTQIEFSTLQNPVQVFGGVGNYSIRHNATNAVGTDFTADYAAWVNVSTPTVTASFTSSSNPATTGATITFTDTSSDSPTTWDWGFDDGSANESTQNVNHAYALPGTYQVFLNASNAYGSYSHATLSQVVANASGANQQDLNLDPQFTMVMHFTDSTGAPIPVVTATDGYGTTYVTTNGTAYFTEPYAVSIWYLTSEGYVGKSVSYVMDQDRDVTVQMYESTSQDVQQQVYPHYVTFHIKEGLGTPVVGVEVAALGVSTSTGNWDWVAQLLGLPLDEVPINGTYMNQTTDSLGRATFYMIPTGKYNVSFTKTGYTFLPMVLVPQDENYVVFATSTTEPFYRDGVDELSSVNISITTTAFNESYAFINLTYTDTTGGTTGGTIRVLQKNDTPWATNTVMATWPVTSNSFTNSTGILHIQQVSGYIDADITHSTFGTVERSYPYSFNSVPVQFLGFSSDIAFLVAMGMLMFTLMLAGAAHVRPILFLVCIEGWVFDAMHWFDSLVTRGVPHESIWLALTIATVMAILANFEVRKKKEKY